MMMYNVCATIIFMLVLPIVLGSLFAKLTGITYDGFVARTGFSYAMGHVMMWAVFQLVAVPLILLKSTLTVVMVIWGLLLVCFVGYAIGRLHAKTGRNQNMYEGRKDRPKEPLVWLVFSAVLALAMVGYQCYMYIRYTHIDNDDSRFIVNAVDAYESGRMFLTNPATGQYTGTWVGEMVKDVSSPWSIWLAMLAKLLNIHPTILAHTVYPAFLLLVGYVAYYLMGRLFFHGDRTKSFLLVAMAATVNMSFGESVFNQSYFTIVRIWQGKAVVAGVLIPLLTYLLFRLYQVGNQTGSYIVLIPTAMAMCLMSGMGIFFSGILIGTFGIWFTLVTKNWRKLLYVFVACIPTIVYGLSYALIK